MSREPKTHHHYENIQKIPYECSSYTDEINWQCINWNLVVYRENIWDFAFNDFCDWIFIIKTRWNEVECWTNAQWMFNLNNEKKNVIRKWSLWRSLYFSEMSIIGLVTYFQNRSWTSHKSIQYIFVQHT